MTQYQMYVFIYRAMFRIILSATLRDMKLLSCFTRSRAQMMWSWRAWIWAAASAADSGYTTVVHPNPMHREDMRLLSRYYSLHKGRKNNLNSLNTRKCSWWKQYYRGGKYWTGVFTNCKCVVRVHTKRPTPTSVMTIDIPTETQIKYLPNTNQVCLYWDKPLDKIWHNNISHLMVHLERTICLEPHFLTGLGDSW